MAATAWVIVGDGREVELRDGFTVGRSDENDLSLERSTVSRHHALISRGEDRWFLEDRGSFNGTYLNGVKIQPGVRLPLRHGDRLTFGDEPVVFSWPSQQTDIDRTIPLQIARPALARPLSTFQAQVVSCLCEPWLSGGSLDDLPSNEEIAARLGTPGAVEAVKAALRRAYAKAGLTEGSPYAKRRDLCKVARQRGWI
jgi:pSer/pThr/pTyr-binding forkhead associated (FHA) protein